MRKFSNLIAIGIGFLFSILILVFIEWICGLNLKYQWLTFSPSEEFHLTQPEPSLERVDLAFLENMPWAEEGLNDFSTPSDRVEAYKNFKCGHRKSVSFNHFWVGEKNCSSKIILKKKGSGRIVYQAIYSFDNNYLRVVPDSDPKAKKAAIFLGCSFTFGEGVNDNETFANIIAKKEGPLNTAIIATPGIGPQHILYILSHPEDPRIPPIKVNEGFAVFTLLDDHIDRAFYTTHWVRGGYRGSDPYYDLQDGSIVYAGKLDDVRPFYSIFSFLSSTNFFKQFQIVLPFRTNGLYVHYAEMFNYMRALVKERFGISKFAIVVYPGHHRAMPKVLFDELKKREIPVVDLSNYDVNQISGNHSFIAGDGHPSAIGHRIYAELLHRELLELNFFEGSN